MSPDPVFWLGRTWCTLPAISVKVRKSLAKIPGDCTCNAYGRYRLGNITVTSYHLGEYYLIKTNTLERLSVDITTYKTK